MPISLFTWLNHRWLIPPAILLLTPFAVWHYIGQVEMIYWSFGEVVGIFIAQFVRKWRELN